MAVDEVNKKGGILGKKIKLIIEDDGFNKNKTVEKFNKLVKEDKVVGIIGALASGSSLAISSLSQKNKIVIIEAIERAGTTDSEKIRDEVAKTNRKFITGNIHFNSLRNPIKPIYMSKIIKDKTGNLTLEYAATIEPY